MEGWEDRREGRNAFLECRGISPLAMKKKIPVPLHSTVFFSTSLHPSFPPSPFPQAYRNHACFSFLAPIMRNSARVKLQNIHRGFQILAASCIALGIAFIFGNKGQSVKRGVLGAWVGVISLPSSLLLTLSIVSVL